MAGRAHVDDSVIERRLRPIYEWLDTGNNKKAVQEADKVLRKQATLHCARVLKGLALLRMSRREECENLISAVIKDRPTDEATLQALTICFREMHQPDQICRVYEMAVKTEPSNEELLSHLFMAYVRIGDYKNQQQTAMKLYKLKPKNPYYFWAVMSYVMQAHKSGDPKGKEVSLLLAERMVNNFVKDGKIEAEAEVMTYLHILETQGKYAEALGVLDGPLAEKVVHQPQNFLALKRATYHSKLGQWEAAASVYKNLISEEPDNWQHYVEYIQMLMKLRDSDRGVDDPLVEAAAFLCNLKQKTVVEKTRNRGPLLGLLQLALVLEREGMSDQISELCGDLVEILHLYIEGYGDKMCCYGDIVNFLPLVPKDRISLFLNQIKDIIHLNEESIPLNVEAIYRNLCWLQLRRALGEQENLNPLQHTEFSDSLVKLYNQTLHLSSHMADTDIRPGDAYLILAAHSYLKAVSKCDVSTDVDSRQVILRIAAILEHGIEISKANFQLKLLLIKVYNSLGATDASHTVYEKCDLKHIQLDTLGHVLALQALDSANYSVSAEIFSSTLKFFMANYKDTSDPLISSYKYGSLTRIPEFVEFRERLNNSLHFAMVTAEQMLMDLTLDISSHSQLGEALQQMDIDPATDKTNWEELCDNRDLRVMNTWEPLSRCLQESDIKAITTADISMLKLRNIMLRLVGAASRLSYSKMSNDQASANKENSECVNGEASSSEDATLLADLTARLEQEYEDCNRYRTCKSPQLPLQGPDPSRIYLYTSGSYIPILVRHARVLHQVHKCSNDSAGNESWSSEVIKEAREEVEELITSHLQHLDALQTVIPNIFPGVNPPAFAHLHHLAQTLGIIAVLLGCCFTILKPIKATVTKKNKKRKEPVIMPEVIPQFASYIASLTSHLQKLEKVTAEKYKSVKSATEENIQKGYSSVDINSSLTSHSSIKPVCEKVELSYVKSLERLSFSIGNKLKYISSLKL
ncbi:N-alpha-acetyltransferase 25, NatB auxiliary subunit isoform X2 [Panulirus ornatus]|uniref:N-alpha-acetyltransferase 25, NatB auxiliary subunit isoform X2 n=2 Tax=Panulirus ornatus TaxID=150431 RepID=UPI003A8BCB9A